MGKPRYRWWGYVKNVIKAYPALSKAHHDDLYDSTLTSPIASVKGKGGVNRTAETIVLQQLPKHDREEYDAVKLAIELTKLLSNGEKILKIIDLAYWRGTHTLEGAGLEVGYEKAQTKRLHGCFVRLVAKNLKLL